MVVDEVVDFPIVQDVQITLSWCRGIFPWSRLLVGPQISQLLHKVVDVPVALSCISLVVAQRQIHMVQTARRTIEIPQFFDKVFDVPVVLVVRVHRHMVLGIMAGIDQKDSCSGMYKAGIAGDTSPRDVFVSLVRRPMMLGIMAGLTQVNWASRSTWKIGFTGK